MNPVRHKILAVVILVFFSALVALADPPDRVARLQYISGAVSIQPHGQDEWVEASINRPLTIGDNIWTDKDSRAELNVGNGAIRLNSETSVTITNISDNTVQVQLHQGTLNVRVRHLYGGEIYEVDTPNIAFTVQKSGVYRFDVDPDADTTEVTVWKGEGDATGDGPAVRVRSHQRARFSGGTSLAHSIEADPRPDGFDDWARVRDRREDDAYSARYVAPGVIGYEDLDDYGSWRTVPAYGPVWVPAVAPGWAPYRFGHWIWIDPWGWTWVDDAPWGFAPFHYGRWSYFGGYWGWIPGPRYIRPVWAPALVAWFGGSHWGVSFGFGEGLGWCPLGYGEPFFPWYGVGRGYFRNVNVSNTRIVNITNITNNYYNNYYGPGARGVNGRSLPNFRYANAKAPGGVTAVPRDVVVHSRPVGQAVMRVPHNALANARAVSRVPVEPTRTSALGVNAGRAARQPESRVINRPVISRAEPPRGMQSLGRGQPPEFNASVAKGDDARGSRRPFGVTTGPSERNVPQPPRNGRADTARGSREVSRPAPQMSEGPRSQRPSGTHYVPRPPQRGSVADNLGGDLPRSSTSRGDHRGIAPSSPRYVPRPEPGQVNRGRDSGERGSSPRAYDRGYSDPSPRSSVPRPSGPVSSGRGRDYPSARGGGDYGSSGRGNDTPRYSAPSSPQWSGNPDRGSYSNRTYGGREGGSYGPRESGGSYGPRESGGSYGRGATSGAPRGGYSGPASGGGARSGGGGNSSRGGQGGGPPHRH